MKGNGKVAVRWVDKDQVQLRRINQNFFLLWGNVFQCPIEIISKKWVWGIWFWYVGGTQHDTLVIAIKLLQLWHQHHFWVPAERCLSDDNCLHTKMLQTSKHPLILLIAFALLKAAHYVTKSSGWWQIGSSEITTSTLLCTFYYKLRSKSQFPSCHSENTADSNEIIAVWYQNIIDSLQFIKFQCWYSQPVTK